MARRQDAIDVACEEWAQVRRRVDQGWFGEAQDWLGAVRCAIAEKRDLHSGSRSEGRITQRFPEVHQDDGLAVARAFQHMALPLREVLYAHYVVHAPVKLKIEALKVSPKLYWERLGRAKAFLHGWLESTGNTAA